MPVLRFIPRTDEGLFLKPTCRAGASFSTLCVGVFRSPEVECFRKGVCVCELRAKRRWVTWVSRDLTTLQNRFG
eukprot:511918-Rhodomonas_salina.2